MKLSALPVGTAGSILNTLREIDVRPIRAAAESSFTMAVVSRDLPMAEHLVDVIYQGPCELDLPPKRSCAALKISQAAGVARGLDVVVIVTREDYDHGAELGLLKELEKARVPALVCLIQPDDVEPTPQLRQHWLPARVVVIKAPVDDAAAGKALVKAIRSLKAIDDVALARHLPAFREAVSRSLIDDCANANAAYSFGTGLLEINPIANIPLNAADIVVLTKNQAIMAYKIALAMGVQGDFREVATKLAAVVGGGFLLRQTARMLIGLLPGLSILPKIAVAYAGTYAAGEAIYRWCATGERLDSEALRGYFDAALQRGRALARNLMHSRKRVKRSSGISELRKPD